MGRTHKHHRATVEGLTYIPLFALMNPAKHLNRMGRLTYNLFIVFQVISVNYIQCVHIYIYTQLY